MSKLSRAVRKIKEKREQKKKEYPVSEDSAMEQIIEILDYYDIPIERFENSGDVQAAGENIIDSLVEFFRSGKLQVKRNDKEELIIVQTTGKGQQIEYGEVKAKHKRAMDKYGRDENYNRMYAFLGALCGQGSDLIECLRTGGASNDLVVAEILGTLFLAV